MLNLTVQSEVSIATHKGEWVPKNTNIKIECYVLENGERVLSLRGTARTLGLRGGGGAALPRMLSSNYIQKYLSEDLNQWISDTENGKVQKISLKDGGPIFHGFKASLLVDLADAFYQASREGVFDKSSMTQQRELAERLYNITLAFSKVGIDAFIDEITGYQEYREKNALQKLLDVYVEGVYQPWQKRFPEEFYKEIYRLKGWKYNGDSKHPQIMEKITNKFIYNFLPKDVMREVKQKRKGNEKIHQWLTSSVGISHLEKQIASTTTLLKASDSWREFEDLFNKSFNVTSTEQLEFF